MAHKVYVVYENPQTGDWTYNGSVMRGWRSVLTYYVVAPGLTTALATAARRRWLDLKEDNLQVGVVALKNGTRYHYPIGRWSSNAPLYPFDRLKTALRLVRHMDWYAQRRPFDPDEDLFQPIVDAVLDTLRPAAPPALMANRFVKQRYQVTLAGADEPFDMYRLALGEPYGYRLDRVRLIPEEDPLRGVYLTDVNGSTSWRPVGPRGRTADLREEHRYLIDSAIRTILDGREFFFAPVLDAHPEPNPAAWRLAQSSHRRLMTGRRSSRV